MKTQTLILGFVLTLALSPVALAAGGGATPPDQEWSFEGVTGHYDQAALQRGLKVYREVCAACHSLDRIRFRELEALGYNEAQIKTIASEYTVMDGPDGEGEMYERPGRPSDAFPAPYANKQAAAAANGAVPPDLSLITKARGHGADYVAALLTGYSEPGHGHEVPQGKHWNEYFPGHVISMAPPLSDDQVTYEDGSPQTAEQYAHDVAHFLTWAADPYMQERKRTGIKVIIFLTLFAGLMYIVKRRIWADVH